MKSRTVIALILLLVITMLVLAGCSVTERSADRVVYAKVRYFDGENEMMELKSFTFYSCMVKLTTTYGDVIYVGPNNVRIIEEEAGR